MKSLHDFPDYQVAQAKLDRFKAELQEANAHRDELAQKINTQASRTEELGEHIRRLLDDEGLNQVQAINLDDRQTQLRKTNDEIRTLQAAIAIQSGRCSSLRAEASREICREALPGYTKAMKSVVDAAVAFAKAADSLMAFRENLTNQDVLIGHLPEIPDNCLALGRWSNPDALIHLLIDSAIKSGLIAEPKDRPRHDPFAGIPVGGVERLAAGPDGIARVTLHADGSFKVIEWLSKTSENANGVDW